MMVFIYDPNYPLKLQHLKNTLGKHAGYKINTRKSVAFPYINDK